MIWLVFAALSTIGLLFVGLPLRRRSEMTSDMADTTPAVLLDQLDEVKRDLERGVISGAEATAAEQEIKRRILMQSRKTAQATKELTSGGRFAIVLSAMFVPAFAFGYYAVMGSPEIPGIAFSERTAERQETAKVADLTNQLYERLTNDPSGGPS